MKQNKQTTITTSEETLRKILREELKDYPTKLDLICELEKIRTEFDDKSREYRDEILTKMDRTMGELDQIREDNLFQNHDIKNLKKIAADHHKRITTLEPL